MLSLLYFIRDEGLIIDIERCLWLLHYSLSIDSLLSLVLYTYTVECAEVQRDVPYLLFPILSFMFVEDGRSEPVIVTLTTTT